MAFNPFHGFRKHQKAFLAVLAILSMFIFVLSGSMAAGWDFYNQLGQILGFSTGKQGAAVATVYGKKIYDPDIRQLRFQRDMANQFMVGSRAGRQSMPGAFQLAADRASLKLADELPKSKLPDFAKRSMEAAMVYRNKAFGLSKDGKPIQRSPQAVREYENQARTIFVLLGRNFFGTPQGEDAQLLALVRLVLTTDFIYSRQPKFFGGSTSTKDLLDFMIWRHQADRLGIQFNLNDTRALLAQVTAQQLTPGDSQSLQLNILRGYRNVTPEDLISALTDEFRVRLAQEALLGSEAQVYDQTKPLLTPYQFWTFYREQRAENTVALLPIPVRQPAFLDKVGQPTEEDLQKLYEENKKILYDPASEDPGFMQPARISLEWVSAKPDSPRFQAAAKVAMAVTQATMPAAYEASLVSAYQNQKYWFRYPSWLNNEISLLDSKVNDRRAIAAGVGRALGAAGTLGPTALEGWLGYAGSTAALDFHRQVPERLRVEASLVSSGMLLAGAGGTPFPTAALAIASAPPAEYLPLDRIRTFVLEKEREEVARKLASNALEQVRKDLSSLALAYQPASELRKTQNVPLLVRQFGQALASVGVSGAGPSLDFLAPVVHDRLANAQEVESATRVAGSLLMAGAAGPGPVPGAALFYHEQNLVAAELKRRVELAIDRYGLEHGATLQLRDQYDLGKDPGLTPLKQAMNRPWPGSAQGEADAKKFGADVFKRVEQGPVYSPEEVAGATAGQEFLYWKTGEKAKYVPTFAEVRDLVKARWLLDKARPLAKEEAERVAKSLPTNTSGPDAERFLKDASKDAGPVFELDHVARLVMPPTAVASRTQAQGFEPYKVPEGKIEYATEQLVDKLVDLKKEGEAVVVHDRPKSTYYVAILVNRQPVYEMSFYKDAERPESLLDWYEKDTQQRAKHLQACLQQLRAEAKLEVYEENIKEGNTPTPADQE